VAVPVGELPAPAGGPGPTAVVRPLADVEREAIEHAMRVFGGNITHAAKALCVNPSTIYRRMAIWAGASGTEVGN
jgi:two-component system repressor protein LuxO